MSSGIAASFRSGIGLLFIAACAPSHADERCGLPGWELRLVSVEVLEASPTRDMDAEVALWTDRATLSPDELILESGREYLPLTCGGASDTGQVDRDASTAAGPGPADG